MPTEKQLACWEKMKGHPQYNIGIIPWNKGIHQWEGKEHPRGMLGKTPWNKGIPCSEKTKIKIGLANSGRKLSKEHKLKISESHKGDKHPLFGKHRSEETKIKISLANQGKTLSTEHKEKLYEGLLKRWSGNESVWTKEYKSQNLKRWRHENGISKSYQCLITTTGKKSYKKLNNQAYKRRVRLGGKLPMGRIQLVYEDNIKKYGTLTCYLCLKPIMFGKDCLEHKIPLSRGGTNEYNNLAIACRSCNSKKHTMTEQEYKKEVSLL